MKVEEIFIWGKNERKTEEFRYSLTITNYYKFPVVYCESVNLIGYITVFYLLIVNSYASVHIARHI